MTLEILASHGTRLFITVPNIHDSITMYVNNNFFTSVKYMSRNSAVGMVSGYGLDDRCIGVRVLVEVRFFSSPRHPDLFWGPLSHLSNEYPGLFPRG
jgi:hypothetical protein